MQVDASLYILYLYQHLYVCTSVCLYLSPRNCHFLYQMDAAGFEPAGGWYQGAPKPVRHEKSCELYPVSRQYIAKANPAPASKLAFVTNIILIILFIRVMDFWDGIIKDHEFIFIVVYCFVLYVVLCFVCCSFVVCLFCLGMEWMRWWCDFLWRKNIQKKLNTYLRKWLLQDIWMIKPVKLVKELWTLIILMKG